MSILNYEHPTLGLIKKVVFKDSARIFSMTLDNLAKQYGLGGKTQKFNQAL